MPRTYRNEETVSRFRKKQKNGDIYVYEGRYSVAFRKFCTNNSKTTVNAYC